MDDDSYYPTDAVSATATYQQTPVHPSAYATDLSHISSPVADPKPRRGRRKAVKPEQALAEVNHFPSSSSSTDALPASGARDVVIKTKFPVARIKRIMQADEDVGKVAQVTPVVVSKALELFMIALCDKASAQARLRNSKRITAGHLKEAVRDEDQFDFLRDIIEKVPNIPDLPTEGSHQSNGGGDSEDGGAPVKKQRRPRQKKIKDDDAF